MWYCNVICLQVGADAYEQAGSGGSGPGFDGSGFGFPFSDIWSEVRHFVHLFGFIIKSM